MALGLETARYIDKGQQVALYVILSNSGDSCTIQSESGFSGHLIESRTATGFDTKLGDFKAPTTGYYALDAGVRLDGAAGTYTRARIAINDQSTTLNGLHSIEGSPEASYYTHSLSGVAKLNAGDTAHLVVFSASDADYTINTDTVFSGVLIGDQIHGFHAGKTRSQSVTGTGWSEVTDWSTSSYLGQFDAGNVMDGTKFRPNRAGFYHLSALIRLDAVGQVLSSNYVRVEICRHDSCITGQSHSIQGSPKNNYFTLRTSGSMYMGSGDSASVFVYSNADASFIIQTESGFSGYLLTTPQEAALTATVLDPQDVCVNTRWEMQVPNGVYMITATYGSPLHSFQTHGCTIEGFSASVGDVPAGQLVSISMQLQVNDGYLTFQGEKASGCTGINRIVVEVANMVQWGRCNLGGWRMNEAQSSDGAYQLAPRHNATGFFEARDES
ncbi:unnamed protein product [Effrenium voratum]|uniref:Uncharacterized protein n=1 Tax=Effrenium voratum TaxID=2562239 RepID=A0AA36IXY1_9DINO|nr:unnamed protein product [Effrenium voratum]